MYESREDILESLGEDVLIELRGHTVKEALNYLDLKEYLSGVEDEFYSKGAIYEETI